MVKTRPFEPVTFVCAEGKQGLFGMLILPALILKGHLTSSFAQERSFFVENNATRTFVEGALMIAVAQILSFIPTGIGSSFSVDISSIPIILFALRHGWKKGVIVSLAYGIFKIAIGDVQWLTFTQGMIEYTIPYFCMGFAGVFAGPLKKALAQDSDKRGIQIISVATLFAMVLRYFWHFVAGVIYWGEFAPEGWNEVVFSAVFNGASGLATALAVILVIGFLFKSSQRLFRPNFR